MASNKPTIPFLQRLKAAAQAEGKSVKTFVSDAITSHIAREQAKAQTPPPSNQ